MVTHCKRILLLLTGLILTGHHSTGETNMIISFEEAHSTANWYSVKDEVMGGISEGGFIRTDKGTLLFSGRLSLENNGGFVSIRNDLPSLNLEGSEGLWVDVRGDGRTYWLDLREEHQRRASSYRAPLPTSGKGLEEIFVPIDTFRLTSFGRSVNGKPLDPSSVRSIGITLSDKQEGPFQLEIISIRSVSGTDQSDP